jgi:hypothetical protein
VLAVAAAASPSGAEATYAAGAIAFAEGPVRINGLEGRAEDALPARSRVGAQGRVSLRLRGEVALEIAGTEVEIEAPAGRERCSVRTQGGLILYPRPQAGAAVEMTDRQPAVLRVDAPASNRRELEATWRGALLRLGPASTLLAEPIADGRMRFHVLRGAVVMSTRAAAETGLGAGQTLEVGGLDPAEALAAPPPACPDPVPEP